jgi:broad specificity phosphatase PhoE
LCESVKLPLQIRESLAEVGFGEWEGRKIDELRPLDRWKQWNSFRSGTRAPGGETMQEIQSRVVGEMFRLREEHPDDCVALVSHGDVIKSAVAYFLGVPLDLFSRIEIGLTSVSIVALADYGPWVLCVNNMGLIELP